MTIRPLNADFEELLLFKSNFNCPVSMITRRPNPLIQATNNLMSTAAQEALHIAIHESGLIDRTDLQPNRIQLHDFSSIAAMLLDGLFLSPQEESRCLCECGLAPSR